MKNKEAPRTAREVIAEAAAAIRGSRVTRERDEAQAKVRAHAADIVDRDAPADVARRAMRYWLGLYKDALRLGVQTTDDLFETKAALRKTDELWKVDIVMERTAHSETKAALAMTKANLEEVRNDRDEWRRTADRRLKECDAIQADLAAARAELAERGAATGAATTNRPRIVCLCGSTRFFKSFMAANYHETMLGRIVLSVGFYPHSEEEAHGESVGITPEQKTALDDLHKRKIDIADEVLVLDVNGYIGSSTRSEIEHAERMGKPIRYASKESAPRGDDVR